jgi:hypothetical protein
VITKFQACLEVTAICLAVMFYAVFVQGCGAGYFSAKTIATYESPDGYKVLYESEKNQEAFKAKIGLDQQGRINSLDIQTTATTPEAAILAAQDVANKLADILQKLIPLLEKAAMAGS